MKNNYAIVIARVDGDDEDKHHEFEDVTTDEAADRAFECAKDSRPETTRDHFYVTGIITSDSPMKIHTTW